MRRFLTRFRRLHLQGLLAHRLAAVSAVLGVAVGTSLVIASQLLTNSLTAPFESIPTALGADGDLIEVNEAFADQYLAVEKELGLDRDRTNVNGGAVALGHPLGMTGTRLVLTLLLELGRQRAALPLGTSRLLVSCAM